MNTQTQAVPGQGPRVLLLNADAGVFGNWQTPEAYYFNLSFVTPASSLVNLSAHPGFSVKPLVYCSNPNSNVRPHSGGFFSVATSEGLADSLLQLSAINDPVNVHYFLTVFPSVIILEQDMAATNLLLLVPRPDRSSVSIGLPLLLTGPPYSTQLGLPAAPASVSLDLSGCLGCVSLPNNTAHMYLSNLHLTGLERPADSSSNLPLTGLERPVAAAAANNSGGGAYQLWAMWAFQFNRSAGSVMRVTLRNVTLTLPQAEFLVLLDSLAAGAGSSGGGWQMKVSRWI